MSQAHAQETSAAGAADERGSCKDLICEAGLASRSTSQKS